MPKIKYEYVGHPTIVELFTPGGSCDGTVTSISK